MTRSVSHMTRTVAGGSAERRQGSCHFLDIENKQACVDAAVSMDQLAQWMLPQGFLPPVITEFKGITVGGAVMGAALESSSFRYGQVSDVCTRFEFELADGQCVDLTPESDLFYGLSGSYGTIGRLKRVYLQVEPVQPWVELSARVCATEHVAEGLSASCTGDADFVDAMALDARRSVVMEGRYVASSSAQRIRFDRPWSKSFCQQVVEAAGRSKWSWSFTTYDYLFRYDLGAFWMGQFPTSRLAVTTFYNHRNDAPVEQARCLHQAFRESPPTLTPSGWLRRLLRAKLSSTHLYATLHRVSQEVLAHTFLVQDFYIPSDRVQEFLSYCHERVAIYPLWLCPMRGTATGQFLSPLFL
ncbi:MAG: FAD-binding oxidoreductase, partial [Chlamydiia bacterium]|nr:FAD-binding oxidoreductase [Chlamydiia bacterium]